MNYTNILKRAWHILWHYPALWVIGFLLAFFGGSRNSGQPASGLNYTFDENNFPGGNGFNFENEGTFRAWLENINRYMDSHFGAINEKTIMTWAILAGIAIFLLVIIGTVIRYVSLTAHIRMVNQLEESGEKVSWWKGLKMGWSNAAFKLWLMDLVVILPTVFVFAILFGCAAIPVILGLTVGEAASAAGVVATIGIALVVMLLAFVAGLVISLWLKIAQRVCVIDGLGVLESLKSGWTTTRKSLKDVLIMWLILVGVRIGFGIVMIPVALILIALSVGVVGGIGLLVYSLAAVESIGLIVAGILLLIVFLAIPIAFVRGMGESYFESVWTLFYREMKAPLNLVSAPVVPE